MPNFSIENQYKDLVIGIDEVGRGPLAGPVVSCAFIFFDKKLNPEDLFFINDSKKLSKKKKIFAIKQIYKLKYQKKIKF